MLSVNESPFTVAITWLADGGEMFSADPGIPLLVTTVSCRETE
jgi:hypothetical protein